MIADKKLSVVIPVYNAENHIENTIQKLVSFFLEENISYEIILVNDNSTDATLTLLITLASKNNLLKVINNTANIGQDSSTLIGIKATKLQTILVIDDDFEFPKESILQLINLQTLKNADVVYGIPIHNKSNFIRKFSHNFSHAFIKLIGFSDASNYKLITGNIVSKLKSLEVKKQVNIDKFLLKNAMNIQHLDIENIPNNHSRYNFRKLVVKTLNFIFYSK
jgi:glycosyltransferase involved in cell wall biosynthesis